MREKPCVRCRRRWGSLRESAERQGENKTDRLRGPEGKLWTINLISNRVQILINREMLISRGMPIRKEIITNKGIHTSRETIINKGIPASREITVNREIPTSREITVNRGIPISREITVNREMLTNRETLTVGTVMGITVAAAIWNQRKRPIFFSSSPFLLCRLCMNG